MWEGPGQGPETPLERGSSSSSAPCPSTLTPGAVTFLASRNPYKTFGGPSALGGGGASGLAGLLSDLSEATTAACVLRPSARRRDGRPD